MKKSVRAMVRSSAASDSAAFYDTTTEPLHKNSFVDVRGARRPYAHIAEISDARYDPA